MTAPDVERAVDALRDARRVVVLTGAGVSTESGVPDFRGAGAVASSGSSGSGGATGSSASSEDAEGRARPLAIWKRFDPSDFSYERFLRDPVRFWELRAELMEALDLANAKPNPAHVALAAASHGARLLGHVTQNIDGLFQAAGHVEDKLVEVHGTATKVRCIQCQRFFPFEGTDLSRLPPRCKACGGTLKPGTILFGELLHAPDLERAQRWMASADAVLVVGSSLVVHPVAALPALAVERGAQLVIVNHDPTPYDDEADAVVRASAGRVLPSILAGAGFIR